MARQQTMASLEAKEELTLKQIQELEEKLRAKKAQLKKVQTQTLTASNKKFKERCTSGRYCRNDCTINSRRYYFHRRNRSNGIYCFTKRKRSSCYRYSYFCRRT